MTPSLDKELFTNEQMIFKTKKHWIIFLPCSLWIIITLCFIYYPNLSLNKLVILPGIVAILTTLNTLLYYVTSAFAITTKRIRMTEGFFYKHTNEARLSTVANVSVIQSLLGQVLNYGTVSINTFGGRDDAFVQVASPNQFKQAVEQQLDQLTNSQQTTSTPR